MQAVQMALAGISALAYAQDDLKRRLECIPSGNQRMKMTVGGVKSVMNDLIGTITQKQALHIYHVMKDMDMRLVPKLTPGSGNFIMSKEEGKELMDCARERCHGCVEDNESCRKCRLYKLMTALVPLEKYEGLICPYSLAEWEE